MNYKECGSELLEGDCICGICGAEVTVFFQNPVYGHGSFTAYTFPPARWISPLPLLY